jgi:hypothetical protein
MRHSVIDTNVLVVANGRADHADDTCRLRSARALLEVERKRSLVLDWGWEILREYSKHVSVVGEPEAGDRFFQWAASSAHIRRVSINEHPDRAYREFPSDPRLKRFDWSDRKFVAATVSSGTEDTELVNAVDSDYSLHRTALKDAGVSVNELCPSLIERTR